jgi:hypothetical protein
MQQRRVRIDAALAAVLPCTAIAVFTTLFSASALAQSAQSAQSASVPDSAAVLKGIRDNQAELRQYSWKMTLTQMAGQRTESTDVYTNAPGADPEGERTITQVETKEESFANRQQQKDSRAQRDRLRRITIAYIEGLKPAKVEAALAKATVEPSLGSTYKVTAHGLVQPGDTVVYYVDKGTNRPVMVTVDTKDGQDPVSIDARCVQPDATGPRVPTRVTVALPGMDRMLLIVNTDFTRPASATASAPAAAPASD